MTSALCQVTFIFLCIWICSCKIFRKPCHGYSHNRVPRSKTWQVGSNKTSSNGNPLPVSQHTPNRLTDPLHPAKQTPNWHTKTGTQQPPKSQSFCYFYFQLKLSLNLSPISHPNGPNAGLARWNAWRHRPRLWPPLRDVAQPPVEVDDACRDHRLRHVALEEVVIWIYLWINNG